MLDRTIWVGLAIAYAQSDQDFKNLDVHVGTNSCMFQAVEKNMSDPVWGVGDFGKIRRHLCNMMLNDLFCVQIALKKYNEAVNAVRKHVDRCTKFEAEHYSDILLYNAISDLQLRKEVYIKKSNQALKMMAIASKSTVQIKERIFATLKIKRWLRRRHRVQKYGTATSPAIAVSI